MQYRKVFKIKNSDNHIIGLCWSISKEEAKDVFCEKIAPPYALINKFWKTTAYFKILGKEGSNVEENQEYMITCSDNSENYIVGFKNDIFDNSDIYEDINFNADESCLIRIVKIYKSGDKCPKDGKYQLFNDSNSKNIPVEKGEKFSSCPERTYFYYIEK